MIKSVYKKILLLMAFALSAACEKELDNPSPAQDVQTVHYSATVQTGIDTRAVISEEMKYEFEAGDRIYLESEDSKLFGFLTLSVDDGLGKNMALFEGDLKYVGEAPFQRNDNPKVNLTLVSKEDKLHTVTADGKVNTSYQANQWAPSLADAVRSLSHFTCTGYFNDKRFNLQQQSGFLKCFVRMYKAEAPAERTFTVKLFNNEQLFRQASVTVDKAGEVPFVFAYQGGQETLDKAKLIVEYQDSEVASFDVAGKELAANRYYSISRSTLSFKGFRIRAKEDGTTIQFNYKYSDSFIEYSLDYGESWIHYTKPFTLQADEVACIKGNPATNYKNASSDEWGTPSNKPIFEVVEAGKLCYISGNIMSLLGDKDYLVESAFQGAFSKGKTAINYIDIDPDSQLELPVTTLVDQCYMQMFRNCRSLTRTPVFTVNGTAYRCCYNMFRDCSGLKDASSIKLPATTVSIDCYRELFRDCTNLKTENEPIMLPAQTLVKECYRQMFSNSKITSIICLATEIPQLDCLKDWVSGITTKGTFYKSPDLESLPKGNDGVPSNWELKNYGE